MKNLALIVTMMLFIVMCPLNAQSVEKGNLVGIHHVTVDLDRDASFNQYKEFLQKEWLPKYNPKSDDSKLYLLEGIRGDGEGSLGFMFVFKDAAARDKYWNEDGTPSELGEKFFADMASVEEAGAKIGTWSSTYTDWLVQ